MSAIVAALAGAHFVAVQGKKPICKGWPETAVSLADAEQRLASGGNIAIRLGPASGDIVDADLDCPEALALADLYLRIEWNRCGMAIFAASGGSEEGFIVFDDLSSKSPKYNPTTVRERWSNYRRSPPPRIGAGTLVYLAREHGWHRGAA